MIISFWFQCFPLAWYFFIFYWCFLFLFSFFFTFYLICVSDLNFESERKTKYVNSKSLHMLIMAKVPRLPNEL